MGSLDQVGRTLRLTEESPVVAQPGWLPLGSGWPVLEELAVEHRRILEAHREVIAAGAALRAEFEAEDEAAASALREAFRRSEPRPDVELTPPEVREERLSAAARDARAASEGLEEFLRGAARTLEENAGEWLEEIGEAREVAETKRMEIESQLRTAQADEMRLQIVREWVARNGGQHERRGFRSLPMRFIAWEQMAVEYRPEPDRDEHDPAQPWRTAVEQRDDIEEFNDEVAQGVPVPFNPSQED